MDTSISLILLTFSGKILYDIIVCSFIVSIFSFCFIYLFFYYYRTNEIYHRKQKSDDVRENCVSKQQVLIPFFLTFLTLNFQTISR